MIKLTIDKVDSKKTEYQSAVKPEVMKRALFLKTSLGHLLGHHIDLNFEIKSIQVVTRDIIRKIEGKKFKEGNYNKANYKKTLADYLASSTSKISSVNIQGIYDLLEELLANNGKEIEELLICPADQLFELNKKMCGKIKARSAKEIEIVKLGFNYGHLTGTIKKFFNNGNFTEYCPYCNLEKVEILEIDDELDATVHHLDHFYSQKTYPLLSYSLFNLVPSGYVCNSKNKGEIPFTEDYHLNPYVGGFGENARFFPIESAGKVTGVDIKFNCANGSKELRQMIGDSATIDEKLENGNINVFKLKKKYSDAEHVEMADNILARIRNAHNGSRSIYKFIKMMKNTNLEEIHLEWYRRQISTPFYSKDFGKMRDSKFNRDIHDYFFERNKSIINKFFKHISPFLKKY